MEGRREWRKTETEKDCVKRDLVGVGGEGSGE